MTAPSAQKKFAPGIWHLSLKVRKSKQNRSEGLEIGEVIFG